MKRAITLALVVMLCAVGLGSLGLAGSSTYKGFQVVSVTINGQRLASDAPAVLIGDRVFVPLRSVEESLGGRVNWDPKTKTAAVETQPSGTAGTGTVTILGEEATAEEIYEAAIVAADAAYDVAAQAAYAVFVAANYSSGPGVDHANWVQACLAADAIREDAYAAARAAYLEAGGMFAMEALEVDPRIQLEEATAAAMEVRDAAYAEATQTRNAALAALGFPYPQEPIYADDREACDLVWGVYRESVRVANLAYQQALDAAQAAYIAAGGTP